jgi:hypothetical protein
MITDMHKFENNLSDPAALAGAIRALANRAYKARKGDPAPHEITDLVAEAVRLQDQLAGLREVYGLKLDKLQTWAANVQRLLQAPANENKEDRPPGFHGAARTITTDGIECNASTALTSGATTGP